MKERSALAGRSARAKALALAGAQGVCELKEAAAASRERTHV